MTDNNVWPEVAWLASFPSSGADYTTHLVQSVSGTAVATNYGVELCDEETTDVPFAAHSESGPYRYGNLPFSDRYILTNTYCSGYCIDCSQGMYVEDRHDFRNGCAVGNHFLCEHGQVVMSKYDPDVVKKLVHLIRDPFDNVVARFHDDYEKHKKRRDSNWRYKIDQNGFKEWCRDLDARFATQEAKWHDGEIAALAENVPCHGIFYQYVKWHNSVFEVLGQYSHRLTGTIIHYKDYQDNIEEAISTLSNFLSFRIIGNPPSFVWEEYPEYFTNNERLAVSSFLKVLASQKVWIEINRYLRPPTLETKYAPLGTVLSSMHYGKWPNLAWIMSFPNSGTFFTMMSTQLRSRLTVATNYANAVADNYSTIPNFAHTENGPFRYSARPFPEKYIPTITHCAGHCSECSPEQYMATPSEFLTGCSRGSKFGDNGELIRVSYDPTLAKRVVHLIRNPFDNVVARFHHAYREHKEAGDNSWTYSYNRDGLKRWCRDLDEQFSNEGMKKWYDDDVSAAAKSVPCHGLFHQYIQWHNNAFIVPDQLGIPSFVLHYEDYHYDLKRSIDNLFGFLGLSAVGTMHPFEFRSYPDYYSDKEHASIASFMKMIASKETYSHLERYFETQKMQDVR